MNQVLFPSLLRSRFVSTRSIELPIALCVLFLFVSSADTLAQMQSREHGPQRVNVTPTFSFAVTPPWQIVGKKRTWVNELQITNEAGQLVARAVINRENQRTSDRALQRLLVTAGPATQEGKLYLLQGWPAYRNSTTERLRNRSDELTETPYQHHVLAVAAGSIFIVIDVSDYSNGAKGPPAAAVSSLLESIRIPVRKDARASERELKTIRDLRIKPWDTLNPLKLPDSVVRDTVRLADRGLSPAQFVVGSFGELELSAAPDGSSVVMGTNNGYANSTDFGATFTAGAGVTPFAGITTRGDPSTAYGVTGSFYLSYIGNPNGSGSGVNAFNGCTLPVAASTDRGATWNFRGNARQCSANVSAASNCFADQEHIAADARNAGAIGRAVFPSSRADQVYAVWREYSATSAPGSPTTCNGVGGIGVQPTGLALVARASCSVDGGLNWTLAPPPISSAPTYDFSKITVGRDGFVYTVSALNKNNGWTELWVDQFSSCINGFNRQFGFPHVVGWYKTPTCVAGLDRCLNLGSPTIAVSPEFGDLVWIGASFPSDGNNDRVIVGLSSDHGNSFFGWKEISDSVPGRKFMPWICVTGKHLFASWYDRRPSNGVATDNSLTDFYLGRMDFEFSGPKVSSNINMSSSPDSQCSSGWPVGARDDSPSSCTIQPQAYGLCTNFSGPNPVVSGNCVPGQLPGTCSATSTCFRPNGGVPKYGDYNGLACGGGTAFAAWSTATPPTAGAPAGINVWVRPYQAVLKGSAYLNWKSATAVKKYWVGP
jgi:hypothetical protein